MSYITPNIIAMGFPAQGFESIYRNSMSDTYRFLNTKHKDHHKIYNLCAERAYDEGEFTNTCQKFRFEDHNPPPFDMILSCCKDIHKYLDEDDKNVAAIHCKAGKGRTGLIICCYLVFARICQKAYEALVYYGRMRTKEDKGVTIPSQIRYVYYFDFYITHMTNDNIKNQMG
jgi:phosphatidylinositol-3,4,5-trisphosphate 3-phosphatase and dual-specificity protein phosphatase PTEN